MEPLHINMYTSKNQAHIKPVTKITCTITNHNVHAESNDNTDTTLGLYSAILYGAVEFPMLCNNTLFHSAIYIFIYAGQ